MFTTNNEKDNIQYVFDNVIFLYVSTNPTNKNITVDKNTVNK
jgi:hypothetical protein